MRATPAITSVGPEAAAEMHLLHAPLFDPPWTTDGIAGQLAQPGCHALASRAAALEGFVLFRIAADEAEILIIAVAPAEQSRGLGSVLLQAALQAAADVDALPMSLEDAYDNAPALKLYARAGFEEAGRRPRYYARESGERVDALLLRRALGEDRLTGSLQNSMVLA